MTTLSLDEFNPKKAELITLADKYRGLTIKDISDKEGYNTVHEAQMELRATRVDIEKRGKEMREDATSYQKQVIALERSLTDIVSEVEEQLKAEKARIDQLKLDIKLKAEREAREITDKRIRDLAQYNVNIPLFELEHMGEVEFITLVETSKVTYEAQQAEIVQAIIDREKLDQERAEFEAEKRKMDAEKQAILDVQNRLKREAEIKKVQEEATIRSRIETEVRMKREAEEAEVKRIADEKVKVGREAKARAEFEAQAQFVGWLKENGLTEENRSEYNITDEDGLKVLWKKISTYQS